MNQSERRLYLIKSLLKEEPSYRGTQIPQGTEKQELLLRGLLNVRPPRPVEIQQKAMLFRRCEEASSRQE